MEAVRKCFQPFVKDGQNVEGQRNITIKFALKEAAGVVCGPSIETIYKVGFDGVTAPWGFSLPDPEYTERARQERVQGRVALMAVLAPDGHTCDIKVTRSLDAELDKKAIEAVGRWRFRPAMKHGQPVAVSLNVEVQFRLY